MEDFVLPMLKAGEKAPKYKHSFVNSKKEDSIMAEMISLVDRESLKQLIYLGSKSNVIMEKSVDWYLNEWAKAKYDFYVLFGNKLKFSELISEKISERSMERLIEDFCNLYKKEGFEHFEIYNAIINKISTSSYVENICEPNETLEKYCEFYKPGTKVSKFFTKYFQDEAFDKKFSEILQNRVVKTGISMSIDPIDYLTSAINKNNWRTCHGIYSGEHACGPFSLMLDEETVVCYRASENIYEYRENGRTFKANSKSSRVFFSLNPNNCAFALHRAYPDCSSEVAYKKYADFISKTISRFLKIEGKEEWTVTVTSKRMDNNSCGGQFESVNNGRMNKDINLDYMERAGNHMFLDPIKYVYSLEKLPIEKFRVGVKYLMCPISGSKIEKLNSGAWLRE